MIKSVDAKEIRDKGITSVNYSWKGSRVMPDRFTYEVVFADICVFLFIRQEMTMMDLALLERRREINRKAARKSRSRQKEQANQIRKVGREGTLLIHSQHRHFMQHFGPQFNCLLCKRIPVLVVGLFSFYLFIQNTYYSLTDNKFECGSSKIYRKLSKLWTFPGPHIRARLSMFPDSHIRTQLRTFPDWWFCAFWLLLALFNN